MIDIEHLTASIHAFALNVLQATHTKTFAAAVLLLFLCGYVILIYNHVVRLQRNCHKAWANIDVLFKQRQDELTKLVEVCKAYMAYEDSVLVQIVELRGRLTRAREEQNMKDLGLAETEIRRTTQALWGLVEQYPELKSDDTFQGLRTRVEELETAIADRREFFNESVTHYNTRISSFPDFLIARLGGFKPAALLASSASER